MGKARISKELLFDNRIRTTQNLIECIRVREDGSGKKEATPDGHEKEGFVPWQRLWIMHGKDGSCLKMKYSIYGTICHLSNRVYQSQTISDLLYSTAAHIFRSVT